MVAPYEGAETDTQPNQIQVYVILTLIMLTKTHDGKIIRNLIIFFNDLLMLKKTLVTTL
jgi:hypothetical protein